MNIFKKDALCAASLVLLIAAVFSTALHYYFLRDETAMIRHISDFHEVVQYFVGFRLIPAALFELVYAFYGTNPAGYYLLNFLLHIANTLLVYVCASWLLSQDGKTRCPAGGFLSALYFSVTYSHHESMFYIPGISDLTATFFCLLCFLCFLYYSQLRKNIPLACSVIFFALFLVSKPIAILFPACLFLFSFLTRMPLKFLVLYIAVIVVYLIHPWPMSKNHGLLSGYIQNGQPFAFLSVLGFYFLDFLLSLIGFTSSALKFKPLYAYFEFSDLRLIKGLQCLLALCALAAACIFIVQKNAQKEKETKKKKQKKEKEKGKEIKIANNALLPKARLVFFLVSGMMLTFLPQAFLSDLYPVEGKLIQYRYLYLPAFFFSVLVAMLVLYLYEKMKTVPAAAAMLFTAFTMVITLNAYESYTFGTGIDYLSTFARKSVKQIIESVGRDNKKKIVVIISSPSYFVETYFKTCITDMVAISSKEKTQMYWIRTSEDLKKLLSNLNPRIDDLYFFAAAMSVGFKDVTPVMRNRLLGKLNSKPHG